MNNGTILIVALLGFGVYYFLIKAKTVPAATTSPGPAGPTAFFPTFNFAPAG